MDQPLFSDYLNGSMKYPQTMDMKHMDQYLSYNQHKGSYHDADTAAQKNVASYVISYIEKQRVPKFSFKHAMIDPFDEKSDEVFIAQLNSILALKPTDIIAVLDSQYNRIVDKVTGSDDVSPKIYPVLMSVFLKAYGQLMLNFENHKTLIEKICDICLFLLKKLIDMVKNNIEDQRLTVFLSTLMMLAEIYIERNSLSLIDNNSHSLKYVLTRFQKLIHKNQIVIFSKVENMTYVTKLNLLKFIFLLFMVDYSDYTIKAKTLIPRFLSYLSLKNKQDVWKRVTSAIYASIEADTLNDISVVKTELKVLTILIHVETDIDKVGYLLHLIVTKLLKASSIDLMKLYMMSLLNLPSFAQYFDAKMLELLMLWFDLASSAGSGYGIIDVSITATLLTMLNVAPKKFESEACTKLMTTLDGDNGRYVNLMFHSVILMMLNNPAEHTLRRNYELLIKVLSKLNLDAATFVTLKTFIKTLLKKESSVNIVFLVNKFDNFEVTWANLFVYVIFHNAMLKSKNFIREDYREVYELTKEVLFDIRKKVENYIPQDSSLELEYLKFKEVVNLMKRIERIDNNTHKLLKTLIRNFCYNLKDYFPRENPEFFIDANTFKIKLPKERVSISRFLFNVFSYTRLIRSNNRFLVNNKNIDSLIHSQSFRSIKSFELGGLVEPIQLNVDIYFSHNNVYAKLGVSNVSSAIVKNLKIDFMKKYLNTFSYCQIIEIENLAPKSFKNYQYCLSFPDIDDAVLKFTLDIVNIEVGEVDLLEDNDNDAFNNRVNVQDQSMDEFNHFIIRYKEVVVPFYMFFDKVDEKWLADLLTLFATDLVVESCLIEPKSGIYTFFKLDAVEETSWFRSLKHNKIFCIWVDKNGKVIRHIFKSTCKRLVDLVRNGDQR